ncbi:MAG: hypothetical protein ACRDT8_00015 [Micromonosporaceae bacterium]
MRDFPASAWQDLGRWLAQRRVELNPRWRHRAQFISDVAPRMRRVITDLETAKRTNYKSETLHAMDGLYGLAIGGIETKLAGGEPVKLEDIEGRDATTQAGEAEGATTTMRVLASELDQLPDEVKNRAVRAVEAAGLAIIRELRAESDRRLLGDEVDEGDTDSED